MNERITLQDLIDLLAKKQDITKKDAESFLREHIAVKSENIENNEPVKIKDFGTFKLVKVNSRKSVDVNTGEAIEIPAHFKLSFTPDKSLKEAINRPFSHFESVVLEDGISFDNVEVDDGIEDTDEPDAIMEEVGETTILGEQSDNKEIIESEQEVAIDEQDVKAEHLIEDTVDEPIDETLDADVNPDKSKEIDDTSDDEFDIWYREQNRKSKRKRLISLGFFIFLIIAGFAVGGYYFQEIERFFSGKASTSDGRNLQAIYKKETLIDLDSLKQKKKLQDSIVLKDTIQEQEVVVPIKKIEPAKDLNKPLATITIKRGHTLRKISLEYYGHKSFWIYIYEENKKIIKNPNNIPIGTKLVIPSPSKYGIDAKNAGVIDKVKRKESKLVKGMSL